MIDELKQRVFAAHRRIAQEGLVLLTWGNVSAVDRREGVFVIKPSGAAYEEMAPDTMVVVSLETGDVVAGGGRPSSDTTTHLELYRSFREIGGIVHTHSAYATAWAQAGKEIPPLGTTHADHFHGPVPVTRPLKKKEIAIEYEKHTGSVIVERFRSVDPLEIPAVLVRGHGPFVWGATVEEAVENAVVLERIAQMAAISVGLNRSCQPIGRDLLDKHFRRKHGPGAYYGQKKK